MTKAVVVVRGREPGQVAELEILADGGPLCVACAYGFRENRCQAGLYFIYQKRVGLRFGPFYPSVPLAYEGMKKALMFGKHHWEHELEWYRQNLWLQKWLDENLGKTGDLVGGQWVDEQGNPTMVPKDW